MSLFVESRSRVNTVAGTSEAFDITVGVHQGSALSPLLFIIVMEEATKLARGDVQWDILSLAIRKLVFVVLRYTITSFLRSQAKEIALMQDTSSTFYDSEDLCLML